MIILGILPGNIGVFGVKKNTFAARRIVRDVTGQLNAILKVDDQGAAGIGPEV